jgi:predicted metal-dependent hydrolase
MLFTYELKESARAKKLRITVHADGSVVVTKPKRVSVARAEKFLASRQAWVEEVRTKLMKKAERRRREGGGVELPKVRVGSAAQKVTVKRARALVHVRLPELNRAYGFTYGNISIRNQKTRWGSCSAKRNLSFNYRIAFLPPNLADYLLVHELCHTKEMNHSAKFWALVEKTTPDYQKLRKQLRALSLG